MLAYLKSFFHKVFFKVWLFVLYPCPKLKLKSKPAYYTTKEIELTKIIQLKKYNLTNSRKRTFHWLCLSQARIHGVFIRLLIIPIELSGRHLDTPLRLQPLKSAPHILQLPLYGLNQMETLLADPEVQLA